MRYKFANITTNIGSINGLATIDELESEPMLFSAGLEFAQKNGGDLTRRIIEAIPYQDCPSDKHIVIDTRVHMLMKGMYPSIPGWHCDGFPRQSKFASPDLNKFDPTVEHFICLLSSNRNGVSKTRFASNPVEINVDKKDVWGSVDAHLKGNKLLTTGVLRDGEIVRFNQQSLHKAQPCHESGWRLFFRLSFYHSQPVNKIRRHSQVYTTESTGW